MIMDTQELFSTAQAVTSTGDTVSTNIYDTGAAADVGIGEDMYLTAKSVAAATSSGSATLQPVLQTSADNSTWVDSLLGPAQAYTVAAANTVLWKTRLPVGLLRYLRVVWRVGTAALTAGTFSAFLTKDVVATQYPASGFSVDV